MPQHAAVDTASAVHYRVYRADGTPSSLMEIESALEDADVLFVGESHNDPIVHYLQRELLERAHQLRPDQGDGIALSMEMFTRDVQFILDEYLDDLVTEQQFLAASNPWDNYESDYRPLVEFAKGNELDVIAANAPRRYANRASRMGRESLNDLSEKARSFLAPLPYAEASEVYTEQFEQAMRDAMAEMAAAAAKEEPKADASDCDCECPMMEGMEHGEGEMDHAKMMEMHHGDGDGEGEMEEMEHGEEEMEHGEGEMDHAKMMEMHDGDGDGDGDGEMEHGEEAMEEDAPSEDAAPAAHGMAGGMPNISLILDSQSLWDATMAFAISEYLNTHPGSLVIHVVGSFHVQTGTGIPEHLDRYAPGTKTVIVSVEPTQDIMTFDPDEHANLGDFVILSDESLPRTFESI